MAVTSAELRKAASDRGIDLELPQNAFLVCRKDPQGGWIQIAARDYIGAGQKAVEQAGEGKFDVYAVRSGVVVRRYTGAESKCRDGGVAREPSSVVNSIM
jgi:hypothetical protein